MSKEQNCRWHFAPSKGGQEQGPNDAMAETFKKVPYDALVRESIQNSLDAIADKNAPVVMSFDFQKINSTDYPEFYELKNHILGCIQKYNNEIARKKFNPMTSYINRNVRSMTVLQVSDSNTTGMPYTRNTTNSPFYSFVKCAGNSVKSSADSGGSYGFGKAAYFNVSKVRAIMVSTKTMDGHCYFEGVASLCTHRLNNQGNYQPVGFYCDNDEEEPVNRMYEVPELFRRTSAGTTVSIMGIDTDESSINEIVQQIAEAAILNFWCAILHGRLVVRINGTIELNCNNIEALAEQFFMESDEDPKYARTRNPRPYLNAVAHANEDNKHIVRELQLKRLGECTLYILKRKTGTDNILYMRSPRMLVYNDKSRTQFGFYGVFLCHNERGNELLKAIEDPSHKEWDWKRIQDNQSERKRARDAMAEMRDAIQNALSDIFASADVDRVDIKGLEDYLYIPTEYDESNDESDHSADVGAPTGIFLEDGTSPTTDITTPPTTTGTQQGGNTTGEIVVKTSTTARPEPGGNLKSGHGTKPRKGTKSGIPMPGDKKEGNTQDEEGGRGYFATEIVIPYRTFSQIEKGEVYHYVVFRSPSAVENLRIRFFSIGEEGEEPLTLNKSDVGSIDGNLLSDCSLTTGINRIRVKFNDSMKHSIKLTTEELKQL